MLNVGSSKWVLIGGALIIGLAIFGAFLPDKPETNRNQNNKYGNENVTHDPRGVALSKLLLLDDFSGYLRGNKHVADWSREAPIEARTNAIQLYEQYNNNEVAADQKYKDKSIAILGRIRKISKDAFGNVYLILDGGGFLRDVQAYLIEEGSLAAANYRPGDDLNLVCVGRGMILTFPVLKSCQTIEALIQSKSSKIEDMADSALNTDHELSANVKMTAGLGYVLGTALPRGNACETATPENMAQCRQAMANIPRPKMKLLYAELAKRGHFPAFPE